MALTLKNPASDIVTALSGQSIGGETLTSGENLMFRPVHPLPFSLGVLVLNTGGPAPEALVTPTPNAIMRAGVQVLVYADAGPDGFDQGEAVARGVLGFLQQIGSTLTGYITVMCGSSQPAYLGPEPGTDRHSWSLNFEAMYKA